MQNINKILETLTLSASDTREDTLKSIVESTLLDLSEPIKYAELIAKVETEFGFQVYGVEFKQIVIKLIETGQVELNSEAYRLTANSRATLKTLEYKIKSDDIIRYSNFKTFVEAKYPALEKDDAKIIWQLFREYIYECFYYYGIKANQLINPKYQTTNDAVFTNSDILYILFEKLSTSEHKEILKYAVDNFATYATKEDIDFLDELGQKTLAFTSLGLDPELAKNSFENNFVDWILFLDTNFLFSVLDLHSNVEDEACKELIKLIQQNTDYIKIEFKYTDLTLNELKKKKSDFYSIDKNLSKSAVSALLKSDDLDEFSRKFYSKLFNQPEATLHPSEVIDLSDITLPKMKIELYRTKVMRDALGESYLNTRIQEYHRFINSQNEFRFEYSKKHPGKNFKEIYRSEPQVEHDITLREVILYRRSTIKKKEFKTMNDVKYFSATLDELLLKYDNYELRKSSTNEYPIFFRPSYLLYKLIKVLPVKTQDYKKAFLKAVSARGFNKDIKKSHDILKIVSYLKSQGIDNEEVVLNLISEQVFLDRFKTESGKDEFDLNNFMESELNRILSGKTDELNHAKEELSKIKDTSEINATENKKLNTKVLDLSQELQLYRDNFEKIKSRINKLENVDKQEKKLQSTQGQLKLEYEKDKDIRALQNEIATLKGEKDNIAKRNFLKRKKFYWRLWAWVISVGLFITTIGAFLFIMNSNKLTLLDTFEYCKKSPIIGLVIALLVILINGFFVRQLYDKYYNHSNIKAFEERMLNKL